MGGFIVPYTVPSASFWKLGQAKPGDSFNFVKISVDKKLKNYDQNKLKFVVKLVSYRQKKVLI